MSLSTLPENPSKKSLNKTIKFKTESALTNGQNKKTLLKKRSQNKIFFVNKNEKRKHFINKKKRPNREDNIRKKFARKFLNCYIIKRLNKILVKNKFNLKFKKFQAYIIRYIANKCNKRHLQMTLEQILENEELYKENQRKNFNHNIKVLKELKSDANHNFLKVSGIERILKSNFCDLVEEYLSSEEFKSSIDQLKRENYNDSYIKYYKDYSTNFIRNYFVIRKKLF